MLVVVIATVCLPIALFWFLALLVWRAQELKLMSSAMTEVAVRLAEPDRAAEQSAASLGQAVRRQVSFMNEAISRALGRAGELEALVHNEVAALEKSYSENEHKIKGLIQELVGERHALVSTTDKVAETLKSMGSEVPTLIEKLSQQQIKLAKIIEGAGQNLIALENKLATASGSLETALANRTQQLQAVLDDYTVALDATLANRAEALDMQLVERTRALDAAFSERLALFDDSMLRSTVAIDNAVNEKARALTVAMENHVRALSDTLGRQVSNHRPVDDAPASMPCAAPATASRASRCKAIEGLSSQADLLKNVSENLVHQISGVTNRFDNQGQSIVQRRQRAGGRQRCASTPPCRSARRAERDPAAPVRQGEQLDEVMRGYSAVGGRHDRQRREPRPPAHRAARQRHRRPRAGRPRRARSPARADRRQSQAVVAEFERLRAQAEAQATRAIEDMRNKLSGVSQEVSQHLGTHRQPLQRDLRRPACPGVARRRRAALEQERLRAEAERLPIVTRESAEAMRTALNDQLRALEQLSTLSARERRDVTPPAAARPRCRCRSTLSLTAAYAARSSGDAASAAAARTGRRTPTRRALVARRSAGARLARRRRHAARAAMLDIEGIARALDPTTASAIWSRFRAGQRGIMVRSIYTTRGARRASTRSPSATAATSTSAAPSTASSPTSSGWCARSSRRDPRARARPPRLRRGPRLPVPGPRQRPAALEPSSRAARTVTQARDRDPRLRSDRLAGYALP